MNLCALAPADRSNKNCDISLSQRRRLAITADAWNLEIGRVIFLFSRRTRTVHAICHESPDHLDGTVAASELESRTQRRRVEIGGDTSALKLKTRNLALFGGLECLKLLGSTVFSRSPRV